MQQPLCHLYFLTVMEHVWSKHHNADTSQLNALTRSIFHIQKEIKATLAEEEVVVIHIELQAVIQMLIQHLAEHLNPEGIHGISDYQLVMENLNELDHSSR